MLNRKDIIKMVEDAFDPQQHWFKVCPELESVEDTTMFKEEYLKLYKYKRFTKECRFKDLGYCMVDREICTHRTCPIIKAFNDLGGCQC